MKYISMIPPLTTADVFRGQSEDLCRVVGENRLLFRYGRDALRVGMAMFGISCGDEVLVPAVICEVVLDSFSERDVRLRYYGLSDSLDFDAEEIEARIGPYTRAIYFNHTLGRPVQAGALRSVCDRHSLILIEDCAHALGGTSEGKPLGMQGDFAIYSYRKFFPLPDGGGLQVNRTGVNSQMSAKRVAPTRQLVEVGKQLVLGIAASIGVPGALWRQRAQNMDTLATVAEIHEFPSHADSPRRMSAVSEWMLSRVDMKEMIARRRDNFAYSLLKVRSLPLVEPLYKDLLPGQVPYSFPLRVEGRARVVREAAAAAIVLEPTLAPVNRRQKGLANPDESFNALDNIAEQVVSIPVHQGMTTKALDRVFDVVRRST